jgi:quercetin dioxygenase-like cupin family protein
MSTRPEQRTTRIAEKLEPSERDRRILEQIDVDPATQNDDHFDYSKVVVRKPWGYEYLIFQNAFAAIWILHIKKGYQTSLHCHPHKKTSITILAGAAICSTLDNELIRHPGDVLLVGEGVFHRTTAVSDEGAFVMEIENPVNKRDLVRYRDDYGREKMGYENVDNMTLNLQNYNYTSFIDQGVYYNVKKRFGRSSIQLARLAISTRCATRWSHSPGMQPPS